MKALHAGRDRHNRPIIAVQHRFLFWTYTREYMRVSNSALDWVGLPNYTLTSDFLGLQLNCMYKAMNI